MYFKIIFWRNTLKSLYSNFNGVYLYKKIISLAISCCETLFLYAIMSIEQRNYLISNIVAV